MLIRLYLLNQRRVRLNEAKEATPLDLLMQLYDLQSVMMSLVSKNASPINLLISFFE